MATRPYKKGTKAVNIKNIKNELEAELKNLECVKSVFWEYLEVFTVETTRGDYLLGAVNGPIGWNDSEGREAGETNETNPRKIALAFEEWLTNGRA